MSGEEPEINHLWLRLAVKQLTNHAGMQKIDGFHYSLFTFSTLNDYHISTAHDLHFHLVSKIFCSTGKNSNIRN